MASWYYVTFCNQENPVTETNLVLLNVDTEERRWIMTGNPYGIAGLGENETHLFVVHQVEAGILVFDKSNWNIVLRQSLQEVVDPHSIVVDGESIHVVSTGTDQVVSYQFDSKAQTLKHTNTWTHPETDGTADTHHINSIYQYDGDLYVSAFGPKSGERWSSAEEGYIYNISTNSRVEELDAIYHPHSLIIENGDYYVCESSRRSVRKNNELLIELESGYVRGLAVEPERILLGTSRGRKVSKSTGVVNNFHDGDSEAESSCTVQVFDAHGKHKRTFDFQSTHEEVYDIIPMQNDAKLVSEVAIGLQNIQAGYDQVTASLQEHRNAFGEAREQMEASIQKADEYAKAFETARTELKAAKQKADEYAKAFESARSELKDHKAKAHEYAQAFEAARKELEESNAERALAKKVVADAQRQLGEQKQQLQDRHAIIVELRDRLNHIESSRAWKLYKKMGKIIDFFRRGRHTKH